MSNSLRIALVAEGKTDRVIIEAALRAILSVPFVLTLQQPEATRPELGEGWGGVLKWCQEFVDINADASTRSLDTDPTLMSFDLVIIHLDADVTEKSYSDCGAAIAAAVVANQWFALPCATPCPPPLSAVQNIQSLLLSWMGITTLGNKSVFCIPSKSSEAWLAAAVLPVGHKLHSQIECNLNMEAALKILPLKQRIKKAQREYQTHAAAITQNWTIVRSLCSQANNFHQDVEAQL